jgi:putative exosortase-associated protein (TIGR04073 family)
MRILILRITLFFGIFVTIFPVMSYADKPLVKLGRGASNLLFAPVEMCTNLEKAVNKRGLPSGIGEGLTSGFIFSLIRFGAGIYDVVTFLIPIPEDYQPIMKPAYVFDTAKQT